MKKFKVTVDGEQYEVEIEEVGVEKTSQVETKVEKVKPEPKAAPKKKKVSGDVSGEKVEAPLPGVIASIEVSEGDSVSSGDVLFVLEAMKMENEITAHTSGTVKEITITEGATVDTDEILAVIG